MKLCGKQYILFVGGEGRGQLGKEEMALWSMKEDILGSGRGTFIGTKACKSYPAWVNSWECVEHKGHIMEEFTFYSADSGEH